MWDNGRERNQGSRRGVRRWESLGGAGRGGHGDRNILSEKDVQKIDRQPTMASVMRKVLLYKYRSFHKSSSIRVMYVSLIYYVYSHGRERLQE